jgi:hypothetical protein
MPKEKSFPKHAWASGVAVMEVSTLHGTLPMRPKPFHWLLDLGAVIEKVLIANPVVLHPGRNMSKYVRTLDNRFPPCS